MRYYNLTVTDANSGAQLRQYTSWINGVTLPGALNIELDVPQYALAQPMGAAYVKVWGISIQDIQQASDLNGQNIQLYGGMQKGLPLANPAQAGLILQGTIQQCFGNWQGDVQTLDIVVNVNGGTAESPANIVNNWRKGMQLSDAIASALTVAFPTYTSAITISQNLVLGHDEIGYYQTISQFASYINQVSKSIVGGDYNGVQITIQENKFIVYDGTTPTSPTLIAFNDLIGQITWIGFNTIQFRCVMRADLQVGDYVQMPQGQVTLTQQSYSQFKNNATFQGTFQIIRVRCIGNFRQPDANSWVTVIDAITTGAAQ